MVNLFKFVIMRLGDGMPTLEEMNLKSSKNDLKKNYEEAKKDKVFLKLVKKLELEDKEAMKITSKLQDALEQLHHCSLCKGLYECKNSYVGHVLFPEKKEGQIYFSYIPCKYQNALQEKLIEKETKANQNELARMKDIDVSDKKRAQVIKWIDQFFQKYDDHKEMKGLYLHGSFGSGKTFLIHALFHELEISKHITTFTVYVPEVLRTLKDDWEVYESKIKKYQTVDLLLLDDIGAEKNTEWGRDEVLGTILQYRMDYHMPTFFTSNMTLEELENHFSHVGKEIDHVKSRRIIERIKQLSVTMELISENRRK